MKRISFSGLIAIIGILVFSSCSNDTEELLYYNKKYKDQVKAANQILKDYYYGSGIPGMSVAVSVGGQLVWSQGFGLADKEQDVPAKRTTKYRIGSTSQVFTTLIAAKLQEEGKLNIDSSFYNYYPAFPRKKWDFTPRMLGAQTVRFPIIDPKFKNKEDLLNTKSFIEKYKEMTLIREPNTDLEFNLYGTTLLGYMLEQVEGKSYSSMLKSRICKPLNLENTSVDNPYALKKDRSRFYSANFVAQLINAEYVDLLPYAPAVGLLSTAEDLNVLAQQVLAPGFLSQEIIDLISNPQELNDGEKTGSSFGWLVNNMIKEDQTVIAQIGNVYGGSSVIIIYPKDEIVVSICANKGDVVKELPAMSIAEQFVED